MKKSKNNPEKIVTSVYLTQKVCDDLDKMATKKGVSRSELVRQFIDKGLSIESYQENMDIIADVLQRVVDASIGKQANRLAAMLFKIGIISSGNYFLATRMLSDVISPSMQEDFKDINSAARRLGIDYMKQDSGNAVDFLANDEAVAEAVGKLKNNFMEE